MFYMGWGVPGGHHFAVVISILRTLCRFFIGA